MADEPLFDPSLKKRKKKAVQFTEDPLGPDADPTAPAPDTIDNTTVNGTTVDMGPTTAHEQMMKANGDADPAADDLSMFADLKKKKKKKEIPMDFGEDSGTSTPIAAPAAGDDLDFSDMKKKKKSSKKKAAFDLEAFEKELNVSKAKSKEDGEDEDDDGPEPEARDIPDVELEHDPFARGADEGAAAGTGNEAWLKSDRDYTYPELLTRFYSLLHAANPQLLASSRKRLMIAPPSLHREGNKRTVFANITDICKKMHRQPEHVISWLFAELGTTGSVDGSSRLVIKGKFNQSQIENVLKGYIKEYVTCALCRSADTLLTKENRIFFMSCESCGSRRSVNAIRTGFQAQVGKRSKNKTG